MVWSVLTARVSPSAAVNGATGIGCSRACSTSSASAGTRLVSRWTRPLTLLAERLTRLGQLGERVVAGPQVRLGGDQVGLRDPHRGLRPALGLGVERDTGVHGQAVVPARGHDHRMPDRDPGDVLDGDGLLVVGQRIRRRPTDPARTVVSRHVNSVPSLRSQVGITTRNRDQASQAQNSNVGRGRPSGPNTIGPAPQSNCNHKPGSVIHGRYCDDARRA